MLTYAVKMSATTADWLVNDLELRAKGAKFTGSRGLVEFEPETLTILRELSPDDDASITDDGTLRMWIGGEPYRIRTYTALTAVETVTDEIVGMVREITDGWYPDTRIDWEDVWDRLDGSELADGSIVDSGGDLGAPALVKIKNLIRNERKAG